MPIEQIANRWISRYAARFTSALVALDDQVRTAIPTGTIDDDREQA